jgi:hypothetical protein
MRGFLAVVLVAFASGQGGSTYSGTWIAELEGTTELAAEGIPAPRPFRLKRIGPKGTAKTG